MTRDEALALHRELEVLLAWGPAPSFPAENPLIQQFPVLE